MVFYQLIETSDILILNVAPAFKRLAKVSGATRDKVPIICEVAVSCEILRVME